MLTNMALDEAVSTPDDPDAHRACLLSDTARAAYHCAETAANLSMAELDTRKSAYWHHMMTHREAYIRWAAYHGFFDRTMMLEKLEAAHALVNMALDKFYPVVAERRYRPQRGLPCSYIKRTIRNQHLDLLRRNRNVTPEECFECWEENGHVCQIFGEEHPWESTCHKCHQLPVPLSFDDAEMSFAAAGLEEEDERSPTFIDDTLAYSTQRPVEDITFRRMLWEDLKAGMDASLDSRQRDVLIQTYFGQHTSREIALSLGTTPGNVDQIRHRATKLLKQLLSNSRE